MSKPISLLLVLLFGFLSSKFCVAEGPKESVVYRGLRGIDADNVRHLQVDQSGRLVSKGIFPYEDNALKDILKQVTEGNSILALSIIHADKTSIKSLESAIDRIESLLPKDSKITIHVIR